MSPQSVEGRQSSYRFSRRNLLRAGAVLAAGMLPLADDVVEVPPIPVEKLPLVDKLDVYRAYKKFFEGTEKVSKEEVFGGVQLKPLSDEISLGWGNGGQATSIDLEVDGAQFLCFQISSDYDSDFSMPVVSMQQKQEGSEEEEESLIAVTQSMLNADGWAYSRFPPRGRHTFTFSPTEFSYGLLTDTTRVQIFELSGLHPLIPGLLELLPEKIGEVIYDPAHPELLFREDITASLHFRDIGQNDDEYRVGLWHKCPKERGGSTPQELLDREREGLDGASHSVIDHDAMSVGIFTKEGIMTKFGWQQDTYRQSHDIIVIPQSYLQSLPNGQPDTNVQRVGDHGLFTRGKRTRGYAPVPEEFLGYDKERVSERNFALGVIGLRQQLARGRMSPDNDHIVALVEEMQRDVIRGKEFINR